jgi:hypothetical protein
MQCPAPKSLFFAPFRVSSLVQDPRTRRFSRQELVQQHSSSPRLLQNWLVLFDSLIPDVTQPNAFTCLDISFPPWEIFTATTSHDLFDHSFPVESIKINPRRATGMGVLR